MSGQLEQDDLLTGQPDREAVIKELGESFKSGKSDPTKEAKKPDDAERPDKAPEGAGVPADGGKPAKPASEATGKGDKPRDETGKFAPAPEPFEGFNDLDPKIQKQFKNLQAEKNRFQNDFASMQGMVPRLQREVQTLQQQLAKPAQTQTQGQKKVDDFLKSEKFKDYESRFPEDALAIREGFQQTVDQLRSEFADSGKPVNDKVAQLEARLGDYERERQFEAAQRESERLTEMHPEWKRIAGWEDDDGNVVSDPGSRKWHPWFDAWKSGLPMAVRASYDQLLGQALAESIGYVITQFKRDVQAHLDASGQQRQDAPAESELAERRSEQLRDITPRPSRSGADQPIPNFNGTPAREAVYAQLWDQWKAGRKLR